MHQRLGLYPNHPQAVHLDSHQIGIRPPGFYETKPLTTLRSTIHDREAPPTEPICMTRSQPSTAGSMTRILNITILISSLKPTIHGSDQSGRTGTQYLITVVHFGLKATVSPSSSRQRPTTVPIAPAYDAIAATPNPQSSHRTPP